LVADTVQIFGHFLTGKNALREIAADLRLVGICDGRTVATPQERSADERTAEADLLASTMANLTFRSPSPRN